MTKKTCEVDGVTYEAAPQGEPGFASPCTGCAADASAMDVSHPLCAKLADCSRDDIIWVVQQ